MVVQTSDPSTWDSEAGRQEFRVSQCPGKPVKISRTMILNIYRLQPLSQRLPETIRNVDIYNS